MQIFTADIRYCRRLRVARRAYNLIAEVRIELFCLFFMGVCGSGAVLLGAPCYKIPGAEALEHFDQRITSQHAAGNERWF